MTEIDWTTTPPPLGSFITDRPGFGFVHRFSEFGVPARVAKLYPKTPKAIYTMCGQSFLWFGSFQVSVHGDGDLDKPPVMGRVSEGNGPWKDMHATICGRCQKSWEKLKSKGR